MFYTPGTDADAENNTLLSSFFSGPKIQLKVYPLHVGVFFAPLLPHYYVTQHLTVRYPLYEHSSSYSTLVHPQFLSEK